MSKTNKNIKSTTKHRKMDTSKLIPIIAIIEVVVLLVVTTLAWFFFSTSKKLSSGVITVEADSGLEIDFQDADKSTYIDIFDHIDKDEFYFEPATSVDGRNIYFPTSGTFGNTETEGMVFRDGTVNDINSKYINIDFELTNTHKQDAVEVYLSHNSFFNIKNGAGKALRMALYNNDGNSGNVASNIISNINKTSSMTSGGEADSDDFTVYFTNNQNWSDVKVYLWDHSGEEGETSEFAYTDEAGVTRPYKDALVQASGYYSTWPGASATKVSGSIYSFTFENPYKTFQDTDGTVYTSTSKRKYDSVVFSNGNGTQTVDINGIQNGYLYTPDGTKDGSKFNVDSDELTLSTVYFLTPNSWSEPRCVVSSASGSGYFATSTGEKMELVTTGIYSYTFPSTYEYIRMIDTTSATHSSTAPSAKNLQNNKLYYLASGDTGCALSTVNYSTSSIYFYNTLDWQQPYAHVNAMAGAVGSYTYAIPMVALSGNLYYCTLPTVYLYDKVYDAGSSLASNCQVYFADKSSDPSEKTSLTYGNNDPVYCKSEYVYTPSTTKSSGDYVLKPATDYSEEVGVTNESYAVISPGVSAGFQRPANPVNRINYTTGSVESIVPTFASSFDDYLIGSKNPVFTIGPQETVNMSMIIWLEGTDAHCTAENYAGNNINLFLEFSTFLAGDTVDGTYTYHFIDSTEQVWTSDTITNPNTGVTVSPVMQLYDKDNDRGYLMSPDSYTTYNDQKKVKVWKCIAPQSLVTDESKTHHIEFRRVNPYDETEVWNRWDAGVGSDFYAYSYSSATRTVSFTAFADGSPEPSYYDGGMIGTHDLPTSSCGGLWGTYDTEILTVYDGRKDRNISTLSFGYDYTYPGAAEPVTIEYKASGYNVSGTTLNNFYSIVIPTTVFQNASNAYFVDYHNVDSDYAINSDRNKDITLGTKWPAAKVGAVRGRFFEFNEEYDFTNSRNKATDGSDYHSYWGSDVLYVQARSSLSVSYSSNSNEAFVQAYFHGSGSEMYSYLYENQSYAGDYGYGFIAVVPCESAFTKYDIIRCKANAHTAVTRDTNFSDNNLASTSAASSDTGHIQNIITDVNGSDARIRILDYDYKRIYFTNLNWGDDYYKPTLQVKSDRSADHGGEGTGEYDNTHKSEIIRYDIRSDSKGQFRTKKGANQKGAYSVELGVNDVKDGIIYYPKDEWSGNDFKMGQYSGSGKSLHGNGDGNYDVSKLNKTLSTFSEPVGYWPHYVPKQVRV